MAKAKTDRSYTPLASATEPTLLLSSTGIVKDCSRSAAKLLGQSRTSLLGAPCPVPLPPLYTLTLPLQLTLHSEAGTFTIYLTQHETRDGPQPEILLTLKLLGRQLESVTPAPPADSDTAGLLRMRSLMESPLQGIAVIRQGKVVFANETFARFLGSSVQEMFEKPITDFLSETSARQLKAAARTRRAQLLQLNGRQPNFSPFHLETWINPVNWDGHSATQLSAIDISSRVMTERNLVDSHSRLLDILNGSHAGIFVKDLSGRYILVNKAFCEIIRRDPTEIIGHYAHEFFPISPEDSEAADNEVIKSRKPTGIQELISEVDGGPVHTLMNKFPLINAEGTVYALCGSSTDITQLRNAEKQLKFMEKREILGLLASSFVHDFNNYLSIIMGNLELAVEFMKEKSPTRGYMQVALDATRKSAKLTSQLLDFIHGQPGAPELEDIARITRDIEPLLRRSLSDRHRLRLMVSDSNWKVFIQKSQYETALLNLVLNARDAMPNGGAITITIRNHLFAILNANRPAELPQGHYVVIQVSDNGVGMSPETRERAFEPFFTTKKKGQGNGLGLPQVYRFVSESGGHMAIDSEEGKGTKVSLYLPRADLETNTEAKRKSNQPA